MALLKYFFLSLMILFLALIPISLFITIYDGTDCKKELFKGDAINIENPNVRWTIGKLITTKNDGKQWCKNYWILINLNGEKIVVRHCSGEIFRGEARVNNNAFYKVYYNCNYPGCHIIEPEFKELSSTEIDSFLEERNQTMSDYYINPALYKEIYETSSLGDQFSDSIKQSNVEGPLFTFIHKTFGWNHAADNCGCGK